MTLASSLRTAVCSTVFGTSLAAGMVFVGATPSNAQSPAPDPNQPGVSTLPEVNVQGAQPENTLQGTTGLGRLPGPIQSIPQTIQVVPQEVMRQQGVTTLGEALRNVPGITASIGEGNGGVNGDQLRIRGFNSQNDLYVDGLRDFGSFRRDAFTFQDVQALLGPSGVTFGSGAAGGVVNVNSRVPFLGNAFSGTVTGGMNYMLRGTADANYQIGPTSAVRLNVMGQTQQITGRHLPSGERWGIAPSFAFGLGTDTTLTLEYLYYRYDEPTDAGFPAVARPGSTVARPVSEYGVSRATWYGSNATDRDQSTVNRLTARLQHRANDWLTVYNDTRVGFQERNFSYSIISCDATCVTRLFSGRGIPQYAFSAAGSPYDSQTWGVQNVTAAVARFNTGSLRHEATFGVDAWYEDFERTGYAYGAGRTAFRGNLFSPDNTLQFPYTRSTANNATRTSQTTQFAAFASDRVWLTPQLSVVAGLRWTRQQTDYQQYGPGQPVTTLSADNSFLDPRAAIVWEPTSNSMLYFSYAQSTFAPGSNWTTQPGQASANNATLEPERNTIYEVGGRASLRDGRLGLSASLYQITKNNATETDPATGTTFSSGDQQRVRGIDLGATGRITDAWLINARYSYMNSETTRSLTPANVGQRVPYVPEHSASLWTSYDLFQGQPWNVALGGGFTVSSAVYLNPANTAESPYSFSLDAFATHRLNDKLTLRVNAYNLTDNRNYVQVWSNRAVMGPGRAITFTVTTDF